MPQFNPEWFASQIFWLVVIFVILYFLMSKVALPRVAGAIEARQQKIEDDLAKAEQLRTEAEQVKEEYEKALSEARAKAHEKLKEASEEISKKQSERQQAFAEEISKKVEEAEERIEKAKSEAVDNLRTVAVEVAAATSQKLIGVEHKQDTVEDAVDEAMKGRA